MVAGSVTNVSVRWSAPSSSISTSRPASRRRAAAVAPPAPVPTTTASAANSASPSSVAPAVTFGYAIRCSGGTRRSAGVAMEELRAPDGERPGPTGPVDAERREHARVLVEGEEDERAEAHQQRGAEAACVLEAREVARGRVGRHRAEAGPAAREERRPELDETETGRQPEAERPREEGEEALDVAEDVVVDRLVEAVAARPDGGDRGAEDAPGGARHARTLGKRRGACNSPGDRARLGAWRTSSR